MAQEKQFENKVKSYLESIGCYALGTPKQDITEPIVGYWEKRWGGGQFTKSGLPDIHVVLHGTSIELELKAPTGKPSELQLKNLDLITKGESYGFILVENKVDSIRLQKWISNKYPQYSHIQVIDFNYLKTLCDEILQNKRASILQNFLDSF